MKEISSGMKTYLNLCKTDKYLLIYNEEEMFTPISLIRNFDIIILNYAKILKYPQTYNHTKQTAYYMIHKRHFDFLLIKKIIL